MAKKTEKRSFNDVLAALGSQRFDVAAAGEGASRRPGAMRVSKYGVAAEIGDGQGGPVMLIQKPGWVLNGEISAPGRQGLSKVPEDLEAGDSGDRGQAASDPRLLAGAGSGDR